MIQRDHLVKLEMDDGELARRLAFFEIDISGLDVVDDGIERLAQVVAEGEA
jgi:hypothetical protein